MRAQTILGVDTSVINKLAKSAEGAAILAGIRTGYYVRLPFTVLSEVISVQDAAVRKNLLYVSNQLRQSGEIVNAPHDILKELVGRFERGLPVSPVKEFDLRFREAETELPRKSFNDIAAQECLENYDNKKLFEEVYARVQPAFDRMRAGGQPLPQSVAAQVAALQAGGAFWSMAKNLMDRAGTQPFDDVAVKKLYNDCDAFRAMLIGLVTAQYDRCVKLKDDPSLRTRRNDTFMTLYLPCFDEFVTNDKTQAACYQEVIAVAGLNVTVRSYSDFANQFSIGVYA